MKKEVILFSAFMALSLSGFSQSQSNTTVQKENSKSMYTPLKPSDASPATFSSQEELNTKVPAKKSAIKDQITLNKDNPEMVKQLRQDLWRFEHAIVVTSK